MDEESKKAKIEANTSKLDLIPKTAADTKDGTEQAKLAARRRHLSTSN